tara:strand:+ start:2738 stop:5104 length:2367 start_codon:yes stop_codon:yes gene_type:complete
MNFIQEVLNLLERKQDKKKLDINRDYFEFGRTKPSSIGNPLYNPKMVPHAIKYKDFKCETIKGLISGTGTEHTLPVWSELDPANCNVQTIVDSVYSQDAGALTGTVDANLTVNGDLLVLGTQTIIESTIVQIADNIIELNTLGADANAGFSVGTVNGNKTFAWDADNLLWNTFDENLMTKDIIVNKHIIMDGESISLITNSVEGLAAEPFDYAIPTTLAVIKYVDAAGGANTTYDLTGQVSGTDDFAIGLAGSDGTLDKVLLKAGTDITLTDDGSNGVTIDCAGGSNYEIAAPDSGASLFGLIGLTKDGIPDSSFKVVGDTWIKPSSNGSELSILHATPKIISISESGELSNGSEFTILNHKFDAAGHIVQENSITYKLSLTGLVPTMTSTVTGTGKLWDDTVQAVPAVSVSAVADRTYGVQFNDAEQLVVNVPWVEGTGGSGTVTAVDFTSDIAAFTAATVDGTTTPSISLDLNGGTAGQFLRQDGAWATIPGGNPGTVTDVSVLVNGGVTDAISLRVFDSTTTPRIELDFDGVADQYINGLGVLTTFPTINPGTVTSFSASLVNGDSLTVAVADSTSTPAANFTWGGTASEYVNGEGDLQPFPAIPAVPFTSLTTTGTSGAATLTSGVLNIPEYTSGGTENCTFGMDIVGTGKALTSVFVPIQSAGSVVLGYENTSGVRTNYLNTISLTFNTKASTKTYEFEIRFEARVIAGVIPLQTYEDSFYSENDKVITKTYTYYSPNLEDGGEIYVSARSLGIGDLTIKTSHIAVVSSSCDAIVDGKAGQIV